MSDIREQSRATGIEIVRTPTHWRLSCQQWVPRPLSEVFPFFASVGNLERLTPPFLRFRIVRAPEVLGPGARIEYRLRLHRCPVWWQTRIDEWRPPRRFVDLQVRGPFRRWHHLHEFVSDGRGTRLTDTVTYDLYARWLARTPLLRWVDGDLRRIFQYRQRQIATIFGGPERARESSWRPDE